MQKEIRTINILYSVNIPDHMLKELGWDRGDNVSLSIQNNTIVMELSDIQSSDNWHIRDTIRSTGFNGGLAPPP